MVFEQSREITNFQKQRPTEFYAPYQINIPQFMQQNGLKGPTGLTWQMVIADTYGLDTAVKLGFPLEYQCAALLTDRLQKEPMMQQDLGIQAPPALGAWLTVRYRSSGTNPEIWVDPIQNLPLPPQSAMSSPDIFFQLRGIGLGASAYSGTVMICVLPPRV